MIIGSNLLVEKNDVRRYHMDVDVWAKDLSIPNPEYQNIMRFRKGKFFRKVPKTLSFLKEKGSVYILPRYYPLGKEIPFEDATIKGRRLKSGCSLRLRDYQQEFFDASSKTIERNTGILIEAACGSGKTACAIWLSYLRGVQTLVLVPTYYLAQQWEERIHEFTDASVFVLHSSDVEVPVDSDFTIAVLDLFNCRSLPKELIGNIGHVVLDEAHRLGAEVYMPILDEVPARYRTALTATFRRRDNAHRILKYHFGEHIKMESRFPKPVAYGLRTGVVVKQLLSKNKPHKAFLDFLDMEGMEYSETAGSIHLCLDKAATERLLLKADKLVATKAITKAAYKEICSCLKRMDDYPYTVLDTYLNEHSGRRKMVITVIRKCLESGRTVLFLSKRKDVLKTMHSVFSEYKPMLIVSETNKRTAKENDYLQNRCRLILGVTQLAKEGLDIDRLDTLIVHLPMVDTEQAVGRISRLCDGKKSPLCLYFLDGCPVAYSVFQKAKKFLSINADYRGDISMKDLDSII